MKLKLISIRQIHDAVRLASPREQQAFDRRKLTDMLGHVVGLYLVQSVDDNLQPDAVRVGVTGDTGRDHVAQNEQFDDAGEYGGFAFGAGGEVMRAGRRFGHGAGCGGGA